MEEKYLSRDGVNLYYIISKKSPILVYLHGTTVNHTVFNDVISHFDGSFGSLAIDQRGDGKSSHLLNKNKYSLNNYTGDLELILENEGIDKVSVIGHSMGSMVAQNFAARNPDKTESLVLISASYDFSKSFGRSFLKRFALKLAAAMRSAMMGFNALKQADRAGINYLDFCSNRIKKMSDIELVGELYRKSSPEYVRAMGALSDAVMTWNTENIASKITAPVFLIHGINDPAVPCITAHELREMIPNCLPPMIIPGADHALLFRDSERVMKVVENFLKTIYD